MTREQTEAMTNAEAARFIAEKVMGWTFFQVPGCPKWVWLGADGKFAAYGDWFPNLDQAVEAAKKVGLELEIKQDSWPDVQVGQFALQWNGEAWFATWVLGGPEGDDAYEPFIGYSKDPARAVCNAVIAAHESGR